MTAALEAQVAQLTRRLTQLERGVRDAPARPIAQVAEAVCAHFNLTRVALFGDARVAHLVLARHTAWALVREIHAISLPRIARAFRRDHTTVLYGVGRIAKLRRTDPIFASQYDALVETLTRQEA